METLKKQISLSELREGTNALNKVFNFKKCMFRGYDPKDVSEYISALKENLHLSERSFKDRIEEYADSLAMITQERDKYLQIINKNEILQDQMKNNIEVLTAENEKLIHKINELSENMLTQSDLEDYEIILVENNNMKIHIMEIQEKLKEYEQYKYDNMKIQITNDQLETVISDLNERIKEYEKNEIVKEQYDAILSENSIIKKQYEEIMSEKSRIIAEKDVLAQQNKRLSDSLKLLSENNKELREINTVIKLKARSMKGEFESKTYEYSQNHKRNMDQIAESLKEALNIIYYEKTDTTNLIRNSYDELEIEQTKLNDDFENKYE